MRAITPIAAITVITVMIDGQVLMTGIVDSERSGVDSVVFKDGSHRVVFLRGVCPRGFADESAKMPMASASDPSTGCERSRTIVDGCGEAPAGDFRFISLLKSVRSK